MAAYPCSCLYSQESLEELVREELDRASAVFLGYPKKIQNSRIDKGDFEETSQVVEFTVLESWKGPKPGRELFVTRTVTTCCLCGYAVAENVRHIVFAFRTSSGEHSLSVCSLTGPAEIQYEVIEILRRIEREQTSSSAKKALSSVIGS